MIQLHRDSVETLSCILTSTIRENIDKQLYNCLQTKEIRALAEHKFYSSISCESSQKLLPPIKNFETSSKILPCIILPDGRGLANKVLNVFKDKESGKRPIYASLTFNDLSKVKNLKKIQELCEARDVIYKDTEKFNTMMLSYLDDLSEIYLNTLHNTNAPIITPSILAATRLSSNAEKEAYHIFLFYYFYSAFNLGVLKNIYDFADQTFSTLSKRKDNFFTLSYALSTDRLNKLDHLYADIGEHIHKIPNDYQKFLKGKQLTCLDDLLHSKKKEVSEFINKYYPIYCLTMDSLYKFYLE